MKFFKAKFCSFIEELKNKPEKSELSFFLGRLGGYIIQGGGICCLGLLTSIKIKATIKPITKADNTETKITIPVPLPPLLDCLSSSACA